MDLRKTCFNGQYVGIFRLSDAVDLFSLLQIHEAKFRRS